MAVLEEALLEGKVYPNCAGCRCSHLSKKGAGPPTRQLICLGLLVLCNALPISSLYPFLYFMVRDFHIAKLEQDIGYYAGVVGSSFMVGRFLTGIYWGIIADKYGRKPVMFAGVISVIVFNTLFGLSNGFWMAVVTRFLLGSFNGMLGTVKAYASEICSEEYQALGVSVVSTTWGLGLIIGPALGGYLSQPATKYPNVFTNPLFNWFPYLLPSLCISSFAILALAISFQLPETLHNHEKSHADCSYYDNSGLKSQHVDATSNVVSNLASTSHQSKSCAKSRTLKKKSLLKNWPLLASIAVYCIWSMHDIAYTEIFSLWAISPVSQGGLNFKSSDVGEVFAISGLCMLMFQLGLFPALDNLLGPIIVTRTSAALSIPLMVAYNYISGLKGVWLWVAILTASVLKNTLSVTTTTGSFLLINNSVTQDQRGAANGLAMSIVSLFKAIGPAGGGSLFAWSQSRSQAQILPGDQLVFFCLNFVTFLTVLATIHPFLPQSTNKQISELISTQNLDIKTECSLSHQES